MLRIHLLWVDNQGNVQTLKGSISNQSSLYHVSAYHGEFEGRSSKHGLSGYPRWCEDPLGLVARVIGSGKPSSTSDLAIHTINHVECSVGIIPGGMGTYREISKCEWNRESATSGALTHTAEYRDNPVLKSYALNPTSKDIWQLARYMLVFALYDRVRPPKAEPLNVPVITHGNLQVVRYDDIPEHARFRFAQRMSHSGRPLIPELGDVCYAWDWARFIGR